MGTGAISLHVDTCIDEEHNLVNTLEMLEKQKVINIDEGAKKRLIAINSRSGVNTDGMHTLPVYKQADDDDVASKKEKLLMKNSKKFLEVEHNGKSIYLRKTTVAWLFQEGERVCSDRLFRVRVK